MASKKAESAVTVFPSHLYPGRHHVTLGEHIIGVLVDHRDGVMIARIKVDRADDGSGIYVEPSDDLAAVYPDVAAAANAVHGAWRAAA